MRCLVVGHDRQQLDLGAEPCEHRGDHRPIGLVDLARPEGLSLSAELRPRRENRDPRPAGAADLAHPRGSKRPYLCGTEACSGLHDDLAG